MVAVPTVRPDTIPEVDPILATPGLLLAQVPPPGEQLSVVDVPLQIARLPDIGVGLNTTFITVVTKHPVARA